MGSIDGGDFLHSFPVDISDGDAFPGVLLRFKGRGGEISRARLEGRSIVVSP